LSRKARQSEPPPARGEIRHVLEFYEQMPPHAAEQLLRKWRRSHAFLKAVWEVERPARNYVAR